MTMATRSDHIEDYMGFVKVCMKSMAMLPPLDTDNLLSMATLFNWSYLIFVNTISVYILTFSVIHLLVFEGPFVDILFNVVHTIIYATNTLLLFYFQIYKNEMLELFEILNTTFRYESAKGLTRLNMRLSFEMANKYSYIFTVACLLGALHWTVLPMVTLITQGVRTLPVDIWYPIDQTASPYYELAYCSQVFGQIMVAIVFSNFGIFFMTECILICGQFDVLCCSLSNLRFTALLARNYPVDSLVALSGYDYSGGNRCTLPEDEWKVYFSGNSTVMDERLKDVYEGRQINVEEEQMLEKNGREIVQDTFDAEVMAAIRDCVIHHQSILDFCARFERFCGPISLVKMLQITLLACFVMYAFSEKFEFAMLEYFSLTCTDLFLLCYFGNEVTLRSMRVGSAICIGPWQLLSVRCLKSLMPVLIRSSIPLRFTGGKFYILSLENYIAVLKGSFSYFTVLRNMNEVDV